MTAFSALNLLIGLGFIAAVAYFVSVNFHQIENLLNSKLDTSLQRESENKSIHPLNKIFLGYKHKSAEEWFNFITTQGIEQKNEAFNNLADFIQVPVDELGSATGEIINALVAFNRDESFDLIKTFMSNSRDKAAKSKVISVHYGTAARALVKLDVKKSVEFFKKELNNMKARNDRKDLQTFLIEALSKAEYIQDIGDLYFNVVRDIDFDISIKELIFKAISSAPDDMQAIFWRKVLEYFIEREHKELNEIEKQLLSIVITQASNASVKANFDVWKTLLSAFKNKYLAELFEEKLNSFIADSSNGLEVQHLDMVLNNPEAKDKLKAAMGQRFDLSKAEYTLLRRDYSSSEYYSIIEKIVHIEKFSKTKIVLKEILEYYKDIELKYLDSSDMNAQATKKSGLVIMTGNDTLAKQYIVTRAAANVNRCYIQVDAEKIIYSLAEMTKLKTQINNRKPCIVFVTNIAQIMGKETEGTVKNNLTNLFKTIIDLSSSPTIQFFAEIPETGEELLLPDNKFISQLERALNKNYIFAGDLNTPDQSKKKEILKNYTDEISERRFKSKNALDHLLNDANEESLLLYVDKIKEILEQKLLTSGLIA